LKKVYPNVIIGEGAVIHNFVVLGFAPRGKLPGELPLKIGKNAIIRPFTIIYGGTEIGDNFQTGKGASVRENNEIGNNVVVGTNAVLEHGNTIGNNVRIHSLCFLEYVTIEDNVFIGPGVIFTDDPHPPCPKYEECLKGAFVKKLAKIGAGSVILPGVIIGENALIGAGSIVAKDVPDNTVVAGVPAKIIKNIDEIECLKGFFKKPYDWPPYNSKKREDVKKTVMGE